MASMTTKSKRMRPAQDVLHRIEWNPEVFNSADILIGYLDRHDGVLEIDFLVWEKEQTAEEFIPLHRIRFFKSKSNGEFLWHREMRIDSIFNST